MWRDLRCALARIQAERKLAVAADDQESIPRAMNGEVHGVPAFGRCRHQRRGRWLAVQSCADIHALWRAPFRWGGAARARHGTRPLEPYRPLLKLGEVRCPNCEAIPPVAAHLADCSKRITLSGYVQTHRCEQRRRRPCPPCHPAIYRIRRTPLAMGRGVPWALSWGWCCWHLPSTLLHRDGVRTRCQRRLLRWR